MTPFSLKNIALASLILLLLATGAFAGAPQFIGAFSAQEKSGELPFGWEKLTFKKIDRHTAYTLVHEEGRGVIKAESQAAASGLIRKTRLDPKEYQTLEWDWKITGVLKKGDVQKKQGDDYPARIYITFKYDPSKLSFSERLKFKTAKLLYGEYPPMRAINYIWASRAPVGTVISNPYTKRVKMIVLQSGASKANQWIHETRNVLEDYRKAFHQEPPEISGIAIMTDTDNTGESAVSYYGDLMVR